MAPIIREPTRASEDTYDLIIVGGGIYGAMLALEATRRKLRPLLIERDDFGGATSFNSLRIIHAGFRYLQSLDFHRVRESIGEMRWFLHSFPNHVKPLPCLIPLYGKGLRRPFILRIGLLTYDYLSRKHNTGVRSDSAIGSGRIIDAAQTRKIFPLVDMEDLQGGAIWYDAFLPDSQRLIMEVFRWSCEYGATCLNYVETTQLLREKNSVAGVLALDRETGKYHEFKASIVLNASGPWCRDLARRFDRDEPTLFKSMMAWNVLFNRKALADYGLAIGPKKQKGHAYFLVPWKGMLFAGTGQAPWLRNEKKPMPSEEQLDKFCADLNLAVPNLKISKDEIIHVFPGLQSATRAGSTDFAEHEVIINHENKGGPIGFYSISGVKFTTSRLVAEKTLDLIFPERNAAKFVGIEAFSQPPDAKNGRGIFSFDWRPTDDDSNWKNALRTLVAEESVRHLDDLIIRRTTLWDNPKRALEIAPHLCDLFDWDESRSSAEIVRLEEKYSR